MRASTQDQVVRAYAERAVFARAESRPQVPRLLDRALAGTGHVAELPCGAGHFLTRYADAGVRVWLGDASQHMLNAATDHARHAGVRELVVGRHFLHDLPRLAKVDLVVVPNGALNQLAAQMPLEEVFAHLRRVVPPAARLLLQYLIRPGTAKCSFYDPALADDRWVADHRFYGPHGQEIIRHRRQYHQHNRSQVRVEFSYTGHAARTAQVHLALPTEQEMRAALEAAKWTLTAAVTTGGWREALAKTGGDQ